MFFASKNDENGNGRCKMTNTSCFSKMTGAAARCIAICLLLACVSMVGSTTAHAQDMQTGLTNCPGDLGAVTQKALQQSTQFGMANALNAGQNSWDASMRNYAQNPRGPIPGVKATFCIGDVLFYFNLVTALLAGGSLIEGAIAAAIAYFANAMCELAKDALLAVANYALNLICIPLPDLSYSMSLPSIERKSCNGYAPLRDAMRVEVVPGLDYSSMVPRDLLTAPLSRWIQRNNLRDFGYSIKNGAF